MILELKVWLAKFWTRISHIQLNKCETDPYFLQKFQCKTMVISAFCKICELNTEHEIDFVICNVYLLYKIMKNTLFFE